MVKGLHCKYHQMTLTSSWPSISKQMETTNTNLNYSLSTLYNSQTKTLLLHITYENQIHHLLWFRFRHPSIGKTSPAGHHLSPAPALIVKKASIPYRIHHNDVDHSLSFSRGPHREAALNLFETSDAVLLFENWFESAWEEGWFQRRQQR